MPTERQLTTDGMQKNLDNNINFSPDGRFVVFDTRGASGINTNTRLGVVDVQSGAVSVFYTQKPPSLGVGAASFIGEGSVVAIHALLNGITYEQTVRGGMLIATDGSGAVRWLDSRDVTPPFTPGALRGGTHKHEPDASGVWVGFTYNDHIMKARGSDLRQVGVSRRGTGVAVDQDAQGANFEGESFTVLLTRCVDTPTPGSDEYSRAEGDCWVGKHGYEVAGKHHRARAFRGLVAVEQDGARASYSDVFVVDVPDDITIPGPTGPLEGTMEMHPQPPRGARVRRLTRTAAHSDPELRGVRGHLRATGSGEWIAFVANSKERGRLVSQVYCVSPRTGAVRRVSRWPQGVAGDLRCSPDSAYVAVGAPDGSVVTFGLTERTWGRASLRAPAHSSAPHNIVISPDSRLIVYNRAIEGIEQVFCCEAS